MFIFDRHKLLSGDVLLTTRDAIKSKVIRKSTDCAFSHAIFYVGSSSYIHSDGSGVHSGNLQRLLLSKAEYGLVLRMVDRAGDSIQLACNFSRNEVGKTYSVAGAVKAKLNNLPISQSQRNRQFCSRLVCQAFEYAGIALAKDCLLCTPADILQSPLLQQVSDCIRPATLEEIEFADSKSMLDVQTKATNEILKKARELSETDVQTFEQVANLLLSNPEFDSQISEVVLASGYCDMWKIDVENNPWRYEGRIFASLPVDRSQLEEMADFEKSNAEEMMQRFQKLYHQYSSGFRQTGLQYFKIESALYAALVDIQKKRRDAACFVRDLFGTDSNE